MKKIRKRYITLIEIMIVMFLIALITGVLAYNYKGSLEAGKVFKTKEAMQRLDNYLNLAIAEDPSLLDDIESRWQKIIELSPLVVNAKNLEYDGWGKLYKVENQDGKIIISSEGYKEYLRNKEGK
jgi:type II secretory pathway pseudopilin PulG